MTEGGIDWVPANPFGVRVGQCLHRPAVDAARQTGLPHCSIDRAAAQEQREAGQRQESEEMLQRVWLRTAIRRVLYDFMINDHLLATAASDRFRRDSRRVS